MTGDQAGSGQVALPCDGYDLPRAAACCWPTVAEVVAGCMHEHVGPRELCRYHLEDASAGRMRCGDCEEAGCGCHLVVICIREPASL